MSEPDSQLPVAPGGGSTRPRLRHLAPLGVMAAAWLVAAALFPSDQPTDALQATTAGALDGDSFARVASGPGGAASGPAATTAVDAGLAAGGPQAATVTQAATGSGRSRSGLDCRPGVTQIPLSTYAAPCRPQFTGDNGGETYRGVTKDKILIVERRAPVTANSQAVAAVGQQAGAADPAVTRALRYQFLDYFNKNYELYGRQVEIREIESTGNSTEEVQGRGIEAACNDATAYVKDVKAFGVWDGSVPFSQCAGERELLVFQAAAYYPEFFYRKYHPFLWATVTECERISNQLAEYMAKRLLNRKAKWAGDPALQAKDRIFATYVPDNDGYQFCTDITEKAMREKYGATGPAPRYNYQLDVSRFPDQAAQAIVQFRSAGATTVVTACDPISIIFLTQAATNQNYFPEWLLLGTALQDTDNLGRLYDQDQADGHMFGMSQLGSTEKLIGPNSEPGQVYRNITGQTIPAGTSGDYFTLVHLFNLLQAAGPDLNPFTLDAGAHALPPGGGPTFSAGYWSLADAPDGTVGGTDHTEIDDAREIYWSRDAIGKADGKKGAFLETYGGRRFRNGEWPAEEPPVYPGRTP